MSPFAVPSSFKSRILLWAGYAAMCIGMFMAIVDIQIVINSLPVIQDALGIGTDEFPDPDDPLGVVAIMDVIEQTSLTLAINEAWLMLAGITALGLGPMWVMGPIRAAPPSRAGNHKAS